MNIEHFNHGIKYDINYRDDFFMKAFIQKYTIGIEETLMWGTF